MIPTSRRLAPVMLLSACLLPTLTACESPSRKGRPSISVSEPENQVVRLQFADANHVVSQIADLYGDEATAGDPHDRFELRVDERTNSVIIRAHRPRLDQLIQLAAQLDIDVE